MSIIHKILTTPPHQLPPVKRESSGIYTIDVCYITERLVFESFSLREVLTEYHRFIIETKALQQHNPAPLAQ